MPIELIKNNVSLSALLPKIKRFLVDYLRTGTLIFSLASASGRVEEFNPNDFEFISFANRSILFELSGIQSNPNQSIRYRSFKLINFNLDFNVPKYDFD